MEKHYLPTFDPFDDDIDEDAPTSTPIPVPLSRSYEARGEPPVIATVDTRIFAFSYYQSCFDCKFCHDSCCQYGVGLDVPNRERILALQKEIAPYVQAPVEQWFKDEVYAETDYPGDHALDTQVVRGACALRRGGARGCGLHAYSLDKGLDYHAIKPIYCSLFPLTCDRGLLTTSYEIDERSLVCLGDTYGANSKTLYRGARDEMLFYFGADCVAELDALEAQQKR